VGPADVIARKKSHGNSTESAQRIVPDCPTKPPAKKEKIKLSRTKIPRSRAGRSELHARRGPCEMGADNSTGITTYSSVRARCNGELRRSRSWVLRQTTNGMGDSESGLRIGPEGVARGKKRGRRGAWVLVDFDFLEGGGEERGLMAHLAGGRGQMTGRG
jgi:hypothetical protein